MLHTFTVLTLALFIGGSAQASTWTLDPTHSRVGFRVSHMMVSSVEGRFATVEGTMDYEVGDRKHLQLKVSVDMGSVNTDNVDRDKHPRSPEFLDAEAHPN